MSDPKLMSYLEGMKKKFWQERWRLRQDEIELQWAARAAPYISILHDPEAPAQPLELTSTQGQQMARQSSSEYSDKTRRRESGTVTPLKLGQRYSNAPLSEPMSRKRARTSHCGPEITALNGTSTPPLDTDPWQLDSNAPYCGYTNTSASAPSFKARRTSTGRMPINILEDSPNVRVYEPADFVQQCRVLPSSNFFSNTRPQTSLNDQCIPPSSLELPSPYSISPTTTVSESFTNTTSPTSAAMSRQDSLGASFYGAFAMMRADSGISEIDLGHIPFQQDSRHASHSDSSSPDGQGVATPFDSSILFAHTGGTAVGTSSASMLAVEQLQLPTTLELETEMNRDLPISSIPNFEQLQSPSTLELHTTKMRDPSLDSNTTSTSRISRRSQEQVAQAARPIAPKDVAESTGPKQSSSFSASQDMFRQRSAPEPKVLIPKVPYSRHTKEKLKCERCNKNPDGYRGSHELHRHMALDHNAFRTAWVCVDISSDGFLSGCAACDSEKPYGQDYNAAAHLRRFHFHPKSEVRRINVDPEEKRGGKGGGKDPSMSECRRWMKKIQVRGKDFMALADSTVNDTSDDIVEDNEESKEEQGEGEREEVVEDPFCPGHAEKNEEPLQSSDNTVGQQNVSSLDGANNLNLALTDSRQFTLQTVDVPFSQSGFQSAFEPSFETYFDSNAASLTTPSINLAYARPTLSSSAPAVPSFLNSDSAEPAQAHNSFVSSTPDSLNLPSTMSTTRHTHTLEDYNNFQTSYRHDNFSYGMSSPNNPQGPCGLLHFPPFP